jgi:hypothetical protein
MTLPSESDPGAQLVRRLDQFRHELRRLGDNPSRVALERLLRRASELGLGYDDVGEELSEIRACLEALDVQGHLDQGELPVVDCLDPLAPGDACHYVSPVRFGRRRSDQFGHLMFTSGWLKFRGAQDLSVSWSEIGSVRRDGRDLIVALHNSRRVLRYSCHSLAEAAVGGVIAEYLTRLARPEPSGPSAVHASL